MKQLKPIIIHLVSCPHCFALNQLLRVCEVITLSKPNIQLHSIHRNFDMDIDFAKVTFLHVFYLFKLKKHGSTK